MRVPRSAAVRALGLVLVLVTIACVLPGAVQRRPVLRSQAVSVLEVGMSADALRDRIGHPDARSVDSLGTGSWTYVWRAPDDDPDSEAMHPTLVVHFRGAHVVSWDERRGE